MNNSIFYFLHSFAFQSNLLDSLIRFFAEPFIYIVIILVIIILIKKYKVFGQDNTIPSLWKRGRNIAIILFATVATYLLANLLKFLFHTDRPFIALSNINTLVSESSYAFPSGHSAVIAAFAFAVFFKNKKLGYICFAAVLLIGLARVAAGVHFPVDIIGGYALGFIVAYFAKSL